MVLYISTDYQLLSIVYLDQLLGSCNTQTSYHDTVIYELSQKYAPFPLPPSYVT